MFQINQFRIKGMEKLHSDTEVVDLICPAVGVGVDLSGQDDKKIAFDDGIGNHSAVGKMI
jgi:hypothetical protein